MAKLTDYERIEIKKRLLGILLNNPKVYTKSELANIFKVSERTIENYIKEFNNNGYDIKTTDKRVAVSRIPSSKEFETITVTKEELKKIIILNEIALINKDEININEVCKNIINNYEIDINDEKYIKKLINQLVKERYIEKDKNYIKSVAYVNDFLKEKSTEEVLVFLSLIKDTRSNSILANRIYQKLLWHSAEFNRNIILSSERRSLSNLNESILRKIDAAVINDVYVDIDYLSNKKIYNYYVAIKNTVYSKEKDLWYLVCDDNTKRKIELRLDKILRITLKDKIVENLDNDKERIYNNSFNVSSENPCKVIIRFNKADFLLQKLINYKNTKKSAIIIEHNDYYILEDVVNGINEIKGWITSFGRAAFCIEPTKLRKAITDDIELLEKRYDNIG